MLETVREHQDGPSWKVVRRFQTFEEAAYLRVQLSEDKDLQVKIHIMGPQIKQHFAVKTRPDPSLEGERLLEEARILKKKRKKKLNKKRRKK
jgi:rRNA processing protein Gar1